MAVLNVLTFLYTVHRTQSYLIEVYTSYLITVDYFRARIMFLKMKVKDMKVRFEENLVSQVISLYTKLMFDFKKQDLLKHLLRNLIFLYIVQFSLLFFLLTLDVHPLLR